MKNGIIFLLLVSLTSPVYSIDSNIDLGRGRSTDILYIHHAPDPVNVRNGNFFLPIQDLYLSCFGFPLEIYRSYNSVSSRNGLFGKGWTFNYDIQLNVDESLGMRVVESDGFVNNFVPFENEKGESASDIEKIVKAKKAEDVKYMKTPDGKGTQYYNDFRQKLLTDEAFLKRQKEKYLAYEAKVSKSGKYVSHERGTTIIEKKGAGFLRTAETGRMEEFNAKGLITRVYDRNDNQLQFSYDSKSRLETVLDSCNQNVRLTYNSLGKVGQIQDSSGRKWIYSYDNNDHLIQSSSSNGEKITLSYDNKDRMTLLTFGDGTKTEMTYEPKTGYVSSQSGPGKKITTYKYGRDGATRWALVEDNEGLKNKYEFSDAEHKTVFTNKNGKKTITTSMACCGKPLSIKDEKGFGDEFQYDDNHNLTSKTDAKKQTTKFEYDPRFNSLSSVKNADGSFIRFIYDGKGNVTYVSNSLGQYIKLTNESHGKIEKMTNEKDVSIVFSYSPTAKPSKIERLMKGARTHSLNVTYDKQGEIDKVIAYPNDSGTTQTIQETLRSFLELLKPAGIDFEI